MRPACWFRRRAETIFSKKLIDRHEFHVSRKVRDRETHALPRECAQIVSDVWIFRCQRFDVANFDVSRFYTGPFGAGTEKPAPPLPDHTRSVEGIAGNQKLHQLAATQVWPYDGVLAGAVSVEH